MTGTPGPRLRLATLVFAAAIGFTPKVPLEEGLRRFVAEYNQRSQATVILTSHYMADVVSLCPRVVLIHQGRLLFDGDLARLAEQRWDVALVDLEHDGTLEFLTRGGTMRDVNLLNLDGSPRWSYSGSWMGVNSVATGDV